MTPGVSILYLISTTHSLLLPAGRANLRLALEVLHDVKEPVVHIRLVGELDLDLVKIAEGILLHAGISTCIPRGSLSS